MQYHITAPPKTDATIVLPASKSISNRALIIHALAGGTDIPQNLSDCDDTEVIVRALQEMNKRDATATNGEAQDALNIDIKAAGTAMRFLTAYLSCRPGKYVLTGTKRMKQRPIKALVDALRYLGAHIEYLEEEGFPPLRISGRPLEGGQLTMAGNVSSQFISALLMIGTVLKRGLELKMTGVIASRPYIDLTLWMMKEFGAVADWTDIDTITVQPQPYCHREYLIENDWTAASYWYEIMALSADPEAEIRLSGLMDGSKQGDSVVRHIFSLLGVKTIFDKRTDGQPTTVTLKHQSARVARLEYDLINSPDLAQTLVVCCAMMNIPFHFKGLASLKIKETDRIKALKTELRKLGYVVQDLNDSELLWNGERCEPTGEAIETYEDHRMALAFAPAAIVYPHLQIDNPCVVTKSYPCFWDDLRQAGFEVTEQ